MSKIAIITGGSRGLGKSGALHLGRAGVDVLLTYNSNRSEAEAVVAELVAGGRKGVALQLDIARSDTFAAFVEQVRTALQRTWKRTDFDFLVNNAGTSLHAPFAETTEEQFDDIFKVHVKGPYFLTQRLLPLLKDGGRIVNTSSGLARFSQPGSSAYASAKGAVEVLTRYLARELGARGIRANTLAPGAIATDFSGGRVRDNPEINKMVASMTALGRVGEPDDVGGALAAMLSEGNGWMNAQRVEVSGGMVI